MSQTFNPFGRKGPEPAVPKSATAAIEKDKVIEEKKEQPTAPKLTANMIRKQEILKKYGKVSDIPLNSAYWKL